MPYTLFKRGGKFCTRNKRTGQVVRYSSAAKRKIGMQMREAFAHGWKPTGKARGKAIGKAKKRNPLTRYIAERRASRLRKIV